MCVENVRICVLRMCGSDICVFHAAQEFENAGRMLSADMCVERDESADSSTEQERM